MKNPFEKTTVKHNNATQVETEVSGTKMTVMFDLDLKQPISHQLVGIDRSIQSLIPPVDIVAAYVESLETKEA